MWISKLKWFPSWQFFKNGVFLIYGCLYRIWNWNFNLKLFITIFKMWSSNSKLFIVFKLCLFNLELFIFSILKLRTYNLKLFIGFFTLLIYNYLFPFLKYLIPNSLFTFWNIYTYLKLFTLKQKLFILKCLFPNLNYLTPIW